MAVWTSYQVTSFFAHTKEKRYALSLVLSFFFLQLLQPFIAACWYLYFYACTIRYIQNVFAYFLMVCFLFLCRTQWTGGCKFQLLQLLPSKIFNNHRTKWKVTVFTPPPPLFVCVCRQPISRRGAWGLQCLSAGMCWEEQPSLRNSFRVPLQFALAQSCTPTLT